MRCWRAGSFSSASSHSSFPAFAHGCHAYGLQHRHNVVDFRCSITIDKVRVRPGDLIFGDGDGVCVIPYEAEGEILNRALAKSQLERNVRRDIESGHSRSACLASCNCLARILVIPGSECCSSRHQSGQTGIEYPHEVGESGYCEMPAASRRWYPGTWIYTSLRHAIRSDIR